MGFSKKAWFFSESLIVASFLKNAHQMFFLKSLFCPNYKIFGKNSEFLRAGKLKKFWWLRSVFLKGNVVIALMVSNAFITKMWQRGDRPSSFRALVFICFILQSQCANCEVFDFFVAWNLQMVFGWKWFLKKHLVFLFCNGRMGLWFCNCT